MCSQQRVFLLSTGCFNPPTNMHLRMMELARDHLIRIGCSVIGGALSPAHDGYNKQDLAPAVHRLKMVQLAVSNSDWIKLSSWEAEKNCGWTRTRLVLDHHQQQLNRYIIRNPDKDALEWLPPDCLPSPAKDPEPVQIKLVCGADYLDSFNRPGVWENEDVLRLIRDYGLLVITREGNDPHCSIEKNDILHSNQSNIHVVQEWIRNEISSTKVRRAIRKSESIRYIVADSVVEYIQKEKLYSDSTVQADQ